MRSIAFVLSAFILLVTPAVAAEPYRSPRTASGAPDLEGLWSSAAITTLERPAAFKALEASDAEATLYEAQHTGVPEPARGGTVGQDESEWWEMGGRLGRIDGRARTSWIVEPKDGQLPYSPAGQAALRARQTTGMSGFDGPEVRPAAERCLMGVGGVSLPPMINAGYNNLIQVVQTRDHVVIVAEMHVGPRIVPLASQPREPGGDWNGRSVGRWQGDTLVVETDGFHPGAQWRAPSRLYLGPRARVVERFTRVGPDELRYAFAVEDPDTFTKPWRGEMPLRRSAGPRFEFACHEGNYSLAGILAGARRQEVDARASAGTPSAPRP